MSRPVHIEREDHPWIIDVRNHPAREDSLEYRHSRALMVKLVRASQPWYLGDPPYQDHHGGGIWLKDQDGWFLQLGLAGIEWSAQFCADPAKVDRLRLQVKRLVAAFPDTVAGYEALGYTAGAELLQHPIATPEDVSAWTDGIFNACVPLPVALHIGTLPGAAGYHHYPKPIIDIELFKVDSFVLFVTDDDGQTVAVTPVGKPGSGDSHVELAWAPDNSRSAVHRRAALDAGRRPIFDGASSLARQAFANQQERSPR